MPYNTRRKSLSLPSLGIHIPVTHAARAAAAAANRASSFPHNSSSARANSWATSPTAMASPSSRSRETPPPPASRKLKRAHSDDPEDDAHSSQPLPKRRDDAKVKFEDTPPPSPRSALRSVEMDDEATAASKEIDLSLVKDEIVEAVIVQLQKTANRPHLVKELEAVLMHQLKIVQQSANPCAIISSRLASYLKRPCWSAKSPCPLAKELESVHPRRTYFYLTTCPHLPLPDPAHAAALSQLAHSRTMAIITPDLSSASSGDSDEADMERRRELSPSPEVDLSSPEFDDMDDEIAMPTTPIGSLSLRGFGFRSHMSHRTNHNGRRGGSPPLEKDEKEFTQTADGLQKRKLKGDLLTGTPSSSSGSAEIDYFQKDDNNGLFGEKNLLLPGLQPVSFVTSPAIRPSTMSLNFAKRDAEAENWLKLDGYLEWDRSPENIALEELDGLLNDY